MTDPEPSLESSNQKAVTVDDGLVIQASDQDVNIDYLSLFISAIAKHSNDKKWTTGQLGGIKTLSNTKVGSVGQDFIEYLCSSLHIPIIFPTNKDHKMPMVL